MSRSIAVQLTVLTVFAALQYVFCDDLFQYEPVNISQEFSVPDEKERVMKLVTVALNPPIFEIPDFLSVEECNELISLAIENGVDDREKMLLPYGTLKEDELLSVFNEMDRNRNSTLDQGELAVGLEDVAGGLIPGTDMSALVTDLKLDPDNDGHINFVEFKLLWTADMAANVRKWLEAKRASDPTFLPPHETAGVNQTWMDDGDGELLGQLRERIAKLLQMPEEIVSTSESVQVIRQQPGGEDSHATYDSDKIDDKIPCGHTKHLHDEEVEKEPGEKGIRKCRFATVRIFLNNVDEGGETAFPFADKKQEEGAAPPDGPLPLKDFCQNTGSCLAIRPMKGKAVLLYNHAIDQAGGWMSDRYPTSMHGECEVIRGEKWVANYRINVDHIHDRQQKLHGIYEESDHVEEGKEDDVAWPEEDDVVVPKEVPEWDEEKEDDPEGSDDNDDDDGKSADEDADDGSRDDDNDRDADDDDQDELYEGFHDEL